MRCLPQGLAFNTGPKGMICYCYVPGALTSPLFLSLLKISQSLCLFLSLSFFFFKHRIYSTSMYEVPAIWQALGRWEGYWGHEDGVYCEPCTGRSEAPQLVRAVHYSHCCCFPAATELVSRAPKTEPVQPPQKTGLPLPSATRERAGDSGGGDLPS